MFNALQFYKDHGIEYRTEGKNVTAGWVNINCPFHSDKTFHLGFDPRTGVYHCWHCKSFSPKKIVRYFIRGNWEEVFNKYQIKNQIRNNLKSQSREKEIPSNIKYPINRWTDRHQSYLMKRGFNPDTIKQKYKITGTDYLDPEFPMRIIIPIFLNNRMVSFQTRDITNKADLRYKGLNKEKEIISLKETLYNIDNCRKDWIVLTEGVFDVWKFGDNCCCTFGVSYTKKQLFLLNKYKKIFICFDSDEAGAEAAERIGEELSLLGKECYIFSLEKKDIDSLTETELQELKKEIEKFL